MNIYRQFIPYIRKLAFEEVHILLHDDISPKLKDYVFRLNNVKYTDGAYHYLYGNMKRIITSFVVFFSDTIDDVIKETDKYSNVITREELIRLMDKTMDIHEIRQAEFVKEYLPVTTPLEKEIYNEIDKQYYSFMEKVRTFKEMIIAFDKQQKVDEFAKEHFKFAVVHIHKALNYTHGYIANMLANRVDEIQVSLKEIRLRMSNNLKTIYEQREEEIGKMLCELYDKNKESLALTRQYKRSSHETAEVDKNIIVIKKKIQHYEGLPVTGQLEEEVAYWNKRVADLDEVQQNIVKLKQARSELTKDEKMYNSLSTIEQPESKDQVWDNKCENFAKRKIYIDEKLNEAVRALITFFCSKGHCRIFYTDPVGQYYVDDFNHQVYEKDHMLQMHHINCDGEFIDIREEAYYFEEMGRYILRDGDKVYRCAPCTSEYKLMDNGLMTKTTKDCGHSEKANDKCRREIKDLTNIEILPITEPVNIKRTLSPEVVKYLWDSFGSVLPEALYDVGVAQRKNPIHHLAHALLKHKYYGNTPKSLRQKIEEADKYRADVFKGRKEKAMASNPAWNVKPRKPEDSDDTLDRFAYDSHIAQQEFIKSLNNFN